MDARTLDGLHILIVEDEFLIAMDMEQLCRDSGASEVTICASLSEAHAALDGGERYDAAIIDMMVDGGSTVDLARRLEADGRPFVFATGYSQSEAVFREFPGVAVVGKPYNGEEMMLALREAADKAKGR